MDQSTIFAPFFAMILLTLLVWTYMYARRIPFIRRSISTMALWFMAVRGAMRLLG